MNNKSSGEELLKYINNLPVSSNGLYDYPNQNVVVPTGGNITMEGIDYPVLGISMETGQQQLMQPGGSYDFINTNNVLEIPQFQNGGTFSTKDLDNLAKTNFLSVVNFEKGYLNSKKIKERIIKSGLDPDKELPELRRLVNTVTLNQGPTINGALYTPSDNEITYTNGSYRNSDIPIMSHEAGHIFGPINEINEDFIDKRNTYADPTTIGRAFQKLRKNFDEKWYAGEGHETVAGEVVADVHALRKELYDTGYDGRYSNFTNEAYNSMKKIAESDPGSISARMLKKIGTQQMKYYNNIINKTANELTPEDKAFLKKYQKDAKKHEDTQKRYIFDIMNKIVSNQNPNKEQDIFYAQDGGKILTQQIPPINITSLGNYSVGTENVLKAFQLQDYENPGQSTIKGFDDYLLNTYRNQGNLKDFIITNADSDAFTPSQEYGQDDMGQYVDMRLEKFFPNGDNFYNRTYIPNDIGNQIELQNAYNKLKGGEIGKIIPETPYTEKDFEKRRQFMIDYINNDQYRNMLSAYYPDARQEQRKRLDRAKSVPLNLMSAQEMADQIKDPQGRVAHGYVAHYEDSFNERNIDPRVIQTPLFRGDTTEQTLSQQEVDDLAKSGLIENNSMDYPEQLKAYLTDGLDNHSVNLVNVQSGEAGVHELGHYVREAVSPNQYQDILKRTRNIRNLERLIKLPNGRYAPVDYVRTPTEITSRLDALRYLMKENGVKDTTKSLNLTDKELEKALENPNINSDLNVIDLIESTNNSQDLLWLLNNIVDNSSKPGQDLRQYMG